MPRKKWLPALSFAVGVWLVVILCFRLFGQTLLLPPASAGLSPLRFGLLEAVTAILLYLVAWCYGKVDRSPEAGRRFAVIGTATGLCLDTFVFWNHELFLPGWSPDQLLSFAVWLCFAYALYLIIPPLANRT
ncbi:DUF5367 family protein [Brevibacillus massiliensis]|jgi:hypothetical protein|uniref:DUF5367 family protein n=1 Tax=Brevibacillus massiliensis TaxID=1118054 RepID=UPI00031BAEF4|nr:DUF5367 family protein [Brevibacillus massiliensis]